MACLSFLAQLRERHGDIVAMGGTVIAVGGAAAYQARHLMDSGVPFSCLLDPEHRLFAALDLYRIPWRAWLWPRTYANYVKGARRARQGRISWPNALQRPGVVILDQQGRLVWAYRGQTVGDYPPVTEVMEQLRRLTTTEGSPASAQ
ncbi:MAG: AhpC/TSA family protein [Candidatus Dormibacteria bacterium]